MRMEGKNSQIVFTACVLMLGLFCLMLSENTQAQSLRIAVKPEKSKGWGIVDEKGNMIVEARFHFCDGYTKDGVVLTVADPDYDYCYLFDSLGQEIRPSIDINIHYSLYTGDAVGFSGGMLVVKKSYNRGAMNTRGELVIPFSYDEITVFDDGYAIGKRKKELYVLNSKGKTIRIDPELNIHEVYHFSEGLAAVEVKGGKFGFIDTLGNMAIPQAYTGVGYFYGGLAWAKDDKGVVGFIDKQGNWVIPPQFDMAYNFDPASGLAMVKLKLEWVYVNQGGKIYRFNISDRPYRYFDGLSIVRKGEKLGFMDKDGKLVIPAQFDTARGFENGYARVEKDGHWGLIDKTGNWILEPVYRDVGRIAVLRN
jgi:hypothetical protein